MGTSYHVLRQWGWEIASVILANGLNVAIAVLLAVYDGQSVPDWGAHLNLNAVLALLSTILRAMLVVVVAQIICQKKWDWFGTNRERPLRDLDRFDSGSRGSMGALLLMPTVVFKDTVTLVAAFVLLASFLIGPFVQQASQTTDCEFSRLNVNASIPYAHYVPRRGGFNPFFNFATATPSADTSVAILSSITAPNGTENQVVGSCTTGRCTFSDGDPLDSRSSDRRGEALSTHSTVGMCNKCVDISSFASISPSNDSETTTVKYMLPTGLNVSSGGYGASFAAIGPAQNLTWMGDRLTPELRAMSRWAYINATFLAYQGVDRTVKAAACVLYPCLRTYTASIQNNSLSEELIGSEVMQIVMGNSSSGAIGAMSHSAHDNVFEHYATVKSPCRANGRVYHVSQNMSSAPGGTKLSLYDFSTDQFTFRNITAPEQCIYRQNSQFVAAIAEVLQTDVFDGTCFTSKFGTPSCSKNTRAGRLENMAVESVLTRLAQGNMSFANTTNLFDSFANAMTNRFRFEYGAATFNETNRNMPLGEIQGIAWQDSTCVQMQVKWLLLPICLTVFTTILMMWTIGANWIHRHTRPVWKGSLYPLIFYGHKLGAKEGEQASGHGEVGGTARNGKLMEVGEMNDISRGTPVTFAWPNRNGGVDYSGPPVYAQQQERGWLQRRGWGKKDGDSLLASGQK